MVILLFMLISEFPKLTPGAKGEKFEEMNRSIFSEYLWLYVHVCIINSR